MAQQTIDRYKKMGPNMADEATYHEFSISKYIESNNKMTLRVNYSPQWRPYTMPETISPDINTALRVLKSSHSH